MTAIKKDMINKAIIYYRIDLVNYSYFMVFKMRENNLHFKSPEKKTHIVNVYDNRVGQSYKLERGNWQVK